MGFFRYRELDELRADIAARGVGVPLADELAPLAGPARVGRRALANRMAVHPMEGCDGNPGGTPGELTVRRWRRFAEGGAALLWGEATAVVPEGRANPRQLVVSRETLPELRRLVAETRAARRAAWGTDDGFLIGMQLTHSGRWSHPAPIIARHGAALDALKHTEDVPAIDDAALEALEQRFVEAAALAREAGFDFVDVKQCHTYLLNELLGARERPGRYGGTFENRTRFVRNVFEGIRARLGDDLLLATRLNVFDGVPWRREASGAGAPAPREAPYAGAWGARPDAPETPALEEPLRLIAELRARGLALLNVTMGSPYFNPHLGRPFERAPVDGYAAPEHPLDGVARHFALTSAVQRAQPDLPVIGTGYSWLRHFAAHAGAANVAAGDVTLFALGRGAIAYPRFAADVLEGRGMRRDESCLGVSYCTALMRAKDHPLGQRPAGCVPRDRLYAEEWQSLVRGSSVAGR
ncbi:MAG TPA: NADH:flavin oxidoreductase [Dehalococcoidia bacterium]|nr:NADH:flavin oxidoreductase [Dehalococcoidia bacterium]